MKNYLGFVLFILQVLHVLSQVSTNNLYFLLDEGKEKCFLEEIPKDTLVMASYKIEPATQQAIATATTLTVKVKVLDNEAKLVLEREMGAENRVAFTSQTSGEHKLCFSSPSSRWFGKLSLVQKGSLSLFVYHSSFFFFRDSSWIFKLEKEQRIMKKLHDKNIYLVRR